MEEDEDESLHFRDPWYNLVDPMEDMIKVRMLEWSNVEALIFDRGTELKTIDDRVALLCSYCTPLAPVKVFALWISMSDFLKIPAAVATTKTRPPPRGIATAKQPKKGKKSKKATSDGSQDDATTEGGSDSEHSGFGEAVMVKLLVCQGEFMSNTSTEGTMQGRKAKPRHDWYYFVQLFEDKEWDKGPLMTFRFDRKGEVGELVWITRGGALCGSDMLRCFVAFADYFAVKQVYLMDTSQVSLPPNVTAATSRSLDKVSKSAAATTPARRTEMGSTEAKGRKKCYLRLIHAVASKNAETWYEERGEFEPADIDKWPLPMPIASRSRRRGTAHRVAETLTQDVFEYRENLKVIRNFKVSLLKKFLPELVLDLDNMVSFYNSVKADNYEALHYAHKSTSPPPTASSSKKQSTATRKRKATKRAATSSRKAKRRKVVGSDEETDSVMTLTRPTRVKTFRGDLRRQLEEDSDADSLLNEEFFDAKAEFEAETQRLTANGLPTAMRPQWRQRYFDDAAYHYHYASSMAGTHHSAKSEPLPFDPTEKVKTLHDLVCRAHWRSFHGTKWNRALGKRHLRVLYDALLDPLMPLRKRNVSVCSGKRYFAAFEKVMPVRVFFRGKETVLSKSSSKEVSDKESHKAQENFQTVYCKFLDKRLRLRSRYLDGRTETGKAPAHASHKSRRKRSLSETQLSPMSSMPPPLERVPKGAKRKKKKVSIGIVSDSTLKKEESDAIACVKRSTLKKVSELTNLTEDLDLFSRRNVYGNDSNPSDGDEDSDSSSDTPPLALRRKKRKLNKPQY